MATQTTMFDVARGHDGHVEIRTPARKSDPVTSKLGADKVAKQANEFQAEFVRRLREIGDDATAKEVVRGIENEVRRETVRKRAHECVALGLIEVAGRRDCQVSGNPSNTYRVKS